MILVENRSISFGRCPHKYQSYRSVSLHKVAFGFAFSKQHIPSQSLSTEKWRLDKGNISVGLLLFLFSWRFSWVGSIKDKLQRSSAVQKIPRASLNRQAQITSEHSAYLGKAHFSCVLKANYKSSEVCQVCQFNIWIIWKLQSSIPSPQPYQAGPQNTKGVIIIGYYGQLSEHIALNQGVLCVNISRITYEKSSAQLTMPPLCCSFEQDALLSSSSCTTTPFRHSATGLEGNPPLMTSEAL